MGPARVIPRDILIEDLLEQVPEAVAYLVGKRIQCIACGAPVWGTLEEAARGKGYTNEEIDAIVADLARMAAGPAEG